MYYFELDDVELNTWHKKTEEILKKAYKKTGIGKETIGKYVITKHNLSFESGKWAFEKAKADFEYESGGILLFIDTQTIGDRIYVVYNVVPNECQLSCFEDFGAVCWIDRCLTAEIWNENEDDNHEKRND